jgi:hypothetical protein
MIKKAVLWIGIVLIPIRTLIFMLMPIRIRIGIQNDADPHTDPTKFSTIFFYF